MRKKLFIFGFGVTGQAIAKAACGYEIYATAKSAETQAKILAAGVTLGVPEIYDYVVLTAPPNPEDAFLPFAKPCCPALLQAKACKAAVYLSTTGVYGDHEGAWINEETTVAPHSPRAIRRLEAEAAWADFAATHHFPLTRFRLSGIYGETRNSLLDLKEGTARRILKENQVFNRIHEADIARATLCFLEKGVDGIVNGADDLPAPSHEIVRYAASLLNLTPPPFEAFETANFSEMARSFWAENKRVDNTKLKKICGEMLYPTYKEGLEACLKALK